LVSRLIYCVTRLLGLLVILMQGYPGLAKAQEQRPPPHLGYGIHVAPNTNVDHGLVDALRMDWVKIYDPGQAASYPNKRILYRMELRWPENWTQFRGDVATKARALIGTRIDAVEIGNEPNLVNEWVKNPNAWEYTQMLRVAYTTIKAANPNLIIVSAGLAPTITTPDRKAVSDLEFAEEMLGNGAGQWFDAFGYHPYGYNQAPEADPYKNQLVFRRTERIRALLEKYGVYKQVWLTEFGWLRDPGEDGVTCKDDDPEFTGFAWLRVSSEQQANYLVRAFQYADNNWPWVGPMFVWNLNWHQQHWLNMCNHQRWFSLLRLNGEQTTAFQRLRAMERRYSDYLPRLELRADTMSVEVALACPRKIPLGKFVIANTGYPAPLTVKVQPVNGPTPPFVEVSPKEARPGDTVNVVVDTTGMDQPGQYTIFINVTATIGERRISQSIQGYVVAGQTNVSC
jgi:hypothetical protein